MLEDAAFHGRLDVLIQHRSFLLSCDSYDCGVYSNAARGLQLECMKWARTKMRLTSNVSASVLNRAMIDGRVDFLQWVHKRDCGEWSLRPSTRLTKIAVVQWLFQYRRTIFARPASLLTHELMDAAAEGGNLELVQWLETQDGVGCSTNAMDLAAAHGHLEVVQYLHHNRTEGCTTAAITEAARRGHVEVAMWVHTHCGQTYGGDIPADAPLDSLRWFLGTRPVRVPRHAIEHTIAQGDLARLKLLCAHSEGHLIVEGKIEHKRLSPWVKAVCMASD